MAVSKSLDRSVNLVILRWKLRGAATKVRKTLRSAHAGVRANGLREIAWSPSRCTPGVLAATARHYASLRGQATSGAGYAACDAKP